MWSVFSSLQHGRSTETTGQSSYILMSNSQLKWGGMFFTSSMPQFHKSDAVLERRVAKSPTDMRLFPLRYLLKLFCSTANRLILKDTESLESTEKNYLLPLLFSKTCETSENVYLDYSSCMLTYYEGSFLKFSVLLSRFTFPEIFLTWVKLQQLPSPQLVHKLHWQTVVVFRAWFFPTLYVKIPTIKRFIHRIQCTTQELQGMISTISPILSMKNPESGNLVV